MADDGLFEDLEDFGDLDETPDFDFGEEDLSIPDFGEPEDEGGISRTFKIVGLLIGIATVVIVVALIIFALNRGDSLTDHERTVTALSGENLTAQAAYDATVVALQFSEQSSQTAVYNIESTATAEALARQTQAAQQATDTVLTATAGAVANQTAAANQAATQAVLDQTQTAEAEANRLFGQVLDPAGDAVGNVQMRLYRDDGDGVFTPEDATSAPGNGVSGSQTTISYGEIKDGTLAQGEAATWTFAGQVNDTVIINAIAADPTQVDMFLELIGPAGTVLAGDDDSGEGTNAAIENYSLQTTGEYTIRVKSVSAIGGDYTLMLSMGLSVPETTPDIEDVPTQESGDSARSVPAGGQGIVLAHAPARAGNLAQETPVPTDGDTMVDIIITAADGSFDFGSMEPGVYWLALDYDSLPPNLQALVPDGEPLVVQATVPLEGEILFEITEQGIPTATPTTPGLSVFDQTATAFAQQRATSASPASPEIGTPQVTITIPDTGIFSDFGDNAGGLSGTNGLTLLGIAAAGLIAVVFIARKLRVSA